MDTMELKYLYNQINTEPIVARTEYT